MIRIFIFSFEMNIECVHCDQQCPGDARFCWTCGHKIAESDIERHIKIYFKEGYSYKTILRLLKRFQKVKMSLRTLQTRLRQYRLRRRNNNSHAQLQRMYTIMQRELNGPRRQLGYRMMWQKLKSKHGLDVKRDDVMRVLRILDPAGVIERRTRRLNRRQYFSNGPNECWHIDGYDKLKPFGFPIHGAIDGFSSKVLWLKFVRSNNDPSVVAGLYLDCVRNEGVLPKMVRSDCGTENVYVAGIQCYMRRNGGDEKAGLNAHVYGSSHHNQRQEAWWSFLRKSTSNWMINFFKELSDNGLLNGQDAVDVTCAQFCFGDLLQHDLDVIQELWNSHYIRRSVHSMVYGRPNELFYVSSYENQGFAVDYAELNVMENFIDLSDDDDIINEYFCYLSSHLSLSRPQTWADARAMYLLLRSNAR